jgi:ketosteroid isomerase-like protein/pimeloyl-ACP methyl ester carboxylesterase
MRTTRLAPLLLFALAGLAACAHRAPSPDPNHQETAMDTTRDRAAITETIHNIARGADLRQWEVVRSSFAARVVLDYGTPELLTPEEIVARWQPLLSAFDSTQHIVRDERIELVEPTRARVHSTFQATHHLSGAPGGALWTLSGSYEHELLKDATGWKVSRMRMIPGTSTGNPGLLEQARQRAGLPAAAPDAFRVERVSFLSEGERVLGNFYVPATASPGDRLPAIAIFGTWTSVKEMIVPHYARILAPAGFAVLTIDFRGFGESDGTPRRIESPSRKIRDMRAAVDFLSSHPAVDAGRIGLVGVCAAAGYAAHAAAADARVRSLVLIAPWLHDRAVVDAVYGGREGVADRIGRGLEARARFEATGVVEYVPAASNTDASAAMFAPGDALDYYLDVRRGGIPQWGNQFALMSWPEWLEFDALAAAPRVRQPTLLVHADTAVIPQGARQFAARMPAPPRELWLTGPTQFDFYDDPSVVSRAAAAAVEHLTATLTALDGAATRDARERNRRVVRAFFERLEAFDVDGFAALFAENGRQVMPFSPGGFPRELAGRAAVFNQYRSMPQNFVSMKFPGLVIHDMLDPSRFFVTYRGEIRLRAGGAYNNTYAGLFEVRDGHIVEFVEYFDPIVLQQAFGGALQDSFNVPKRREP